MQSGLTPYNDATRAVIETLSGVRTPERALVEFFGIRPTDGVCPSALRDKQVWWTPALERLGFDEEKFRTAIRALCPDVPAGTFEPPKKEKKKRPASE
jgi:hypothetical protein